MNTKTSAKKEIGKWRKRERKITNNLGKNGMREKSKQSDKFLSTSA